MAMAQPFMPTQQVIQTQPPVIVPTPLMTAPSKIPYTHGLPPPAAPPGYTYVVKDQIAPLPIICCIIWFPIGLLFLLCAIEKYWVLQQAPVVPVAPIAPVAPVAPTYQPVLY